MISVNYFCFNGKICLKFRSLKALDFIVEEYPNKSAFSKLLQQVIPVPTILHRSKSFISAHRHGNRKIHSNSWPRCDKTLITQSDLIRYYTEWRDESKFEWVVLLIIWQLSVHNFGSYGYFFTSITQTMDLFQRWSEPLHTCKLQSLSKLEVVEVSLYINLK